MGKTNTKTESTTLIVDSVTNGNSNITSGNKLIYKLDDFITLTGNKVYTLVTTGQPANAEISMSFIDVNFMGFTITIQDESTLMPTIIVSNSTTFLFKLKNNRWYRII